MKRDLAIKGISGQPEDREAAARFAVLIAQKNFRFLRSNMTWDWKGHVLATVSRHSGKTGDTDPPEFNQLSLSEKILFLKYFLESDGALLSGIARQVVERGGVSKSDLYKTIEGILDQIFDCYEGLARTFRERTKIKSRRREAIRQTKGNSRQRSTLAHKVLPHVQAMVDLGLLVESDSADMYLPKEYSGRSAVQPLTAYIDHLDELETLFAAGNPYDVIARAYSLKARPASIDHDWEDLLEVISSAYSDMKDSTTGLAYIKAVVDWCCTVLLSERLLLVSPSEIGQAIDELYRRDPSAIRFHVDFDGKRSYMIMSLGEN